MNIVHNPPSIEKLEEAKNRPIDLGEEQLLLAPVRGGAVVWCEDVTDIRCVLKQLEANAEQLESSTQEILQFFCRQKIRFFTK